MWVVTMNRLMNALLRHPHYKLLAFFTALATWFYVQGTEVSVDTYAVDVEWRLPADRMAVNSVPNTVQIVVDGSRNALRAVPSERLKMVMDLSSLPPEVSTQTVAFKQTELDGLPSNVTLRRFVPGDIDIELDEVGTRNFTIRAQTIGTPANGYMVGEVRLDTGVVELQGPNGRLALITEVNTLPIDVSDLRHDRRVEVRLDLPRGIERKENTVIQAQIDIEPKVAGRTVLNVPVHVRSSRVWQVIPSTIKVRLEGPAASLQKVHDDEVIAVVNLPDDAVRGNYDVPFSGAGEIKAKVIISSESVTATVIEPAAIKVVRK